MSDTLDSLLKPSLLYIVHRRIDGAEAVMGTGFLVAKDGPILVGMTAAHVLTAMIEKERPRGARPHGLFANPMEDIDITAAIKDRRFCAMYLGPDDLFHWSYIQRISGIQKADVAGFLAIAAKGKSDHLKPLPITTDVPRVGTEVRLVAPRQMKTEGGIVRGQLNMMGSGIHAHHAQSPTGCGPCFDFGGGIYSQNSGSPIVASRDGSFLDPIVCGIASSSGLPDDREVDPTALDESGTPCWISYGMHMSSTMAIRLPQIADHKWNDKRVALEEYCSEGRIENVRLPEAMIDPAPPTLVLGLVPLSQHPSKLKGKP